MTPTINQSRNIHTSIGNLHRGMQAIKNGNRDMDVDDALKEFDKIAIK